MRNYEQELENRVAFIRQLLKESGCEGIVYGNSGGKDSALVGILCKKACGKIYYSRIILDNSKAGRCMSPGFF